MSSGMDPLDDRRRRTRDGLAEAVRMLRDNRGDEPAWVLEDLEKVFDAIKSDYTLVTFMAAVTGVYAKLYPRYNWPGSVVSEIKDSK